ncbi:MAG: beta-ketoacyl synthase chain length factor [Prevotellaceae bacterium]|jgi:3-oxoacyl-(acyl-carrier-protein) synthase|nr:beta-ketoacyl synthase chain length factor [Prevotellaceae bacterium]
MKKKVYINAATAICSDGKTGGDGILHVVEPDYKEIITNANLRRRMSRIVKMGVACSLQCFEKNGNKPVDAIITATGLGCLADTEKFMNSIVENNEQLLNPTAFTQSTFNVIGAQIALLTNNKSYNNTYVHRGHSFESALLDGMMRVNEGDKNVLVGAMDEATLFTHMVMQRMGLLKNTTMGEGSQFFVLADEPEKHIELKTVQVFTGKFGSDELVAQIQEFLRDNNLKEKDINLLITGENGNTDWDKIYAAIHQKLFSTAVKQTFKQLCGEYPTASSYALYMAFTCLETDTALQNVLIYNNYNTMTHSLILLGR